MADCGQQFVASMDADHNDWRLGNSDIWLGF